MQHILRPLGETSESFLGRADEPNFGILRYVVKIWGWVKTLVPGEPQNSWDLWMFIPLKMVLIGIDPYPYDDQTKIYFC